MADVMTTIGMRDTDVVSTLTRLETFVKNFKEKMEAKPIALRMQPVALAGQDSAIYQSVFNKPDAVAALQAKFGGQAAGMSGVAGLASKLGGYYQAISAAIKVGSEIDRAIERIAAAGRAQREWRDAAIETANAYIRVANSSGMDIPEAKRRQNDATAEAFEASSKIGKDVNAKLKAATTGSWTAQFGNWGARNTAAFASRVPILNKMYDFGDGMWAHEQDAKLAATVEEQSNRIAERNARNIRAMRAREAESELEAARKKFIEDGMALNSQAEAAQREAVARVKTAEAMKKSREEATKSFEIEQMSGLAVIRRLSGREKEARLIESRADYLRRNAALDQNENLTTAQKSQGQWQSWGIYEAMVKAINDGEEKARIIRGFDYSAGGGSQTLMAALGGSGRMQQSLDNIDKNTAAMARKPENAAALNVAIQQASRAIWN
ncbi:MAG: hypothetical protein JSS51_03580 [Planctomycetes bacterium]|nr:hypothetical protein [Planctomycetota bacterium]